MNKLSDGDSLLEDVLAENASPDFRAALLGQTLRQARRRRFRRRAGRAAMVVMVLSVLGGFAWWNLPVRAPASKMLTASYEAIHTRPLPHSALIATQPLNAGLFIVSVPTASRVSTTANSADYRFIDDDELLAMAPQPAVLIRMGPRSQQLIFVAPGDRSPLPLY
jgi:hypothetical protein